MDSNCKICILFCLFEDFWYSTFSNDFALFSTKLFLIGNPITMQRKGISEVVNIFRYNSPSKAYVKRLGGMPKYIKERPTEEPPVDYSKLKYLSKEDAPFAVLDDSLKLIYR